ncbi:hypothetical protein [Cupriavidus lacunae]|uniref:hypothetical protein n=1 Tax=Cupriavidus lacunae TaxID=2666307 RepID=UPI001374CF79|nr:hypothetical protein [Cupriavidus lacunae]
MELLSEHGCHGGLPGEADAWDFGVGAGFYVDATEAPWNQPMTGRAPPPPGCRS